MNMIQMQVKVGTGAYGAMETLCWLVENPLCSVAFDKDAGEWVVSNDDGEEVARSADPQEAINNADLVLNK